MATLSRRPCARVSPAGVDAPTKGWGWMPPTTKQRMLLSGGNRVMTTLSVRRILAACILCGAFAVALVAPGAASAESLGEQCSGETPIKGRGSTFQGLAQEVWTGTFNEVKGKPNKNVAACGGSQGGKKVIKVEYLQKESEDRGSGSCLKAFGSGLKGTEKANYGRYAFCGTDEAPSSGQRTEMENHKEGGISESIESIP